MVHMPISQLCTIPGDKMMDYIILYYTLLYYILLYYIIFILYFIILYYTYPTIFPEFLMGFSEK